MNQKHFKMILDQILANLNSDLRDDHKLIAIRHLVELVKKDLLVSID